MRQQLGDDDELIAEVIGLFLEDYPAQIDAIAAAIAAQDAEGVHAAAHSLKGSAGNLVAHGVVSAARSLEAISRQSDFPAIERCFADLRAEAARLAVALTALQPRRP